MIRKEAVIIEIKSVRNGETLGGQCDLALRQIEERHYEAGLEFENYCRRLKWQNGNSVIAKQLYFGI